MSNPLLKVMDLLDAANIPGRDVVAQVQCLLDSHNRACAALEVQARRTDRQRLLEQLDEDRSEVLMMLADACLDEELEAESKAWRWLAMHKKWPYQRQGNWYWSTSSECASVGDSHTIPHPIARIGPMLAYPYGTPREALVAAVGALVANPEAMNRSQSEYAVGDLVINVITGSVRLAGTPDQTVVARNDVVAGDALTASDIQLDDAPADDNPLSRIQPADFITATSQAGVTVGMPSDEDLATLRNQMQNYSSGLQRYIAMPPAMMTFEAHYPPCVICGLLCSDMGFRAGNGGMICSPECLRQRAGRTPDYEI